MQKKLRTLDEILQDREFFTEEQAKQVEKNALKEAHKYWGGKREGAGRKAKGSNSLNITIKVSSEEQEFLKYARANSLNLKQLMQGC